MALDLDLTDFDYEIAQSHLDSSQVPATMQEAAERLAQLHGRSKPLSSTAVKNRLEAAALEFRIPFNKLGEFRKERNGAERMIGLTSEGWDLLRSIPDDKQERHQWYEMARSEWSYLATQEVIQAEVVGQDEDGIGSDEFTAIVQRRQDELAIFQADAIAPINLFGGLNDLQAVKQLLHYEGRRIGHQLGAAMAAGLNQGLAEQQALARSALMEGLQDA